MNDPFKIVGPAVIRFSGGRTSAFMLHQILAAHGGGLPSDVHVVFSNTGKERPETLDFVAECGQRWDVRIRWIEWRLIELERFGHRAGMTACETYAEVDHVTASRTGEPFERLVRWKQYLPNPVQRVCTQHLKIEAMKCFAVHGLGFDEWDSIIGIRADEPRRWRIIGQDPRNKRETIVAPLKDAGIAESHVMDFWARQPFDLGLRSDEGNCDLCFLKGTRKLRSLMRRRPDLADWWIGQEALGFGKTPEGSVFRANRPGYAAMLDQTRRLPMLPGIGIDEDESLIDCACTD